MFRKFNQYTKRNPVSIGFYTKNYELIPIPIISIATLIGTIYTTIRNVWHAEINVTRATNHPADRVERLINGKSTKFLHYNETLEPNQELYDLLEEMRKCEEDPDNCPPPQPDPKKKK